MRNYSLSDEPGKPYYRISVKRECARVEHAPDGYVSSYLHDVLKAGDKLEVAPPCGEFILNVSSKKPLVLLAGGVGITPLLSMVKASLANNPKRLVYLFQGARHGSCHAFRDEIRQLAAENPNLTVHIRYSEPKDGDQCDSVGLLDLKLLRRVLPSNDCDFYCCGPKVFMQAMMLGLLKWGVNQENVFVEFFGPKEELKCPVALS